MLRGQGGGRPALACTKQGMFSHTTDCVSPPVQTTCIAQSQQPRQPQQPHAQLPSPQQPPGQPFTDVENMPPLDHSGGPGFHNILPATSTCSASGVVATGPPAGGVITTSIDEGVELDFSEKESEVCSTTSVYSSANREPQMSSQPAQSPKPLPTGNVTTPGGEGEAATGLTRSNVFGDLSQISTLNTSNQSISTGIGSPFTSFDSNIEADLMSSLSSCAQPSLPSCTYSPQSSSPPRNQNSAITATMTPPIATKFPHQRAGGGGDSSGNGSGDDPSCDDRSATRSPVHFREGRRASDGLMSQGVIAFRQRLKESMKTRGVTELRKEMENLQNQYKTVLTEEELKQLQQQHCQYQEKFNNRQWSLDEPSPVERPKLTTKRMSLPTPGQFEMHLAPHKILAMKHSMQVERHLDPVAQAGVSGPPTGAVAAAAAPVAVVPSFSSQAGQAGQGDAGQQQGLYPGGTAAVPTKPLQQQLLQHRLQQKRQVFQKQAQHAQQPHQLYQQFQSLNIDSSQQQQQQHYMGPPQQIGPPPPPPPQQLATGGDQPQQLYLGEQPGAHIIVQEPAPHHVAMASPCMQGMTPMLSSPTSVPQLPSCMYQEQAGLYTLKGGPPAMGEFLPGSQPSLSDTAGLVGAQMVPDLNALQQQAASIQSPAAQTQLMMMRRHVVRQTSYKLAQQTPVMPPYGGVATGEGAEQILLPWLTASSEQPQLSPTFEGEEEEEEESAVAGEDENAEGGEVNGDGMDMS